MWGRACVSSVVVIALFAQNLAYAGRPRGERQLEEPLLAADSLASAPSRNRSDFQPDLEMQEIRNVSGVASEEALEDLLLPPTVSPSDQSVSPEVEAFLKTLGLSVNDLTEKGLSLQRLQELHDLDTTWRTSCRWMAVDSLFEKALDYLVLGKRALTQPDTFKQPGCDKRAWISGRDLPVLSKSTRRNLVFMEGFRSGSAFLLFRELHFAVLTFLGYDIVSSIQSGKLSFEAFISVFRSQERATINYLLSFLQNPAGPVIVTGVIGAPLLWGVVKGIWNCWEDSRSVTHTRTNFQEDIRNYPKGFWPDILRWFLPFHPLDRKLNALVRTLRFNGDLSPEEVTATFQTLKDMATDRLGYSPIVALHYLANIAYGINVGDFSKLIREPRAVTEDERERLLTYLRCKLESDDLICTLSDNLWQKWKTRNNLAQGADLIITGLYARYLRWSLGQDNWGWLTMGSLKAAKGVLFGFFLKRLIEALIEYFNCPETFQHLRYGEIGPVTNTLECFEAYVRIFNQIPGQPVETLLELIPYVDFPNTEYALDLSNHGIGNVTTLVRILDTFNKHGITLPFLDLSGNLGLSNTEADFGQLGLAIGRHPSLQTLIFQNNGIEEEEGRSNSTIAFVQGFQHQLPLLEFLDFTQNSIGSYDSHGTMAIAQALRFFPRLRALNLSNNLVDNTDTQGLKGLCQGLTHLPFLTTLNLMNNAIGNINDLQEATILGQSLPALKNILTIDLRFNGIGSSSPNGTQFLGQGLSALPQLQQFLFVPQRSPTTNEMVTFLNSGLQATHACCIPPMIDTVGAVEAYLSALPSNTTQILLSGRIVPEAPILQTLFQGLQRRFSDIIHLDLSGNGMGFTDSSGTVVVGGGLCSVPQLRFLNLSLNAIGRTDEEGVRAIGNNLSCVPQLITLDLSSNSIGGTSSSGVVALATGFQYIPQLTFLSFGGLSGNVIGYKDDAGTAALGNALPFLSRLTSLDLSRSTIGRTGDTGTQTIGENLPFLSRLTSLNLGDNDIALTNDTGTVEIGKALAWLPQLVTADFSLNFIGSQGTVGAAAIGEGLKNNTRLETLNLASNALGYTGLQGIEVLLNSVVRNGLNLNLGGAAAVPWTTASNALYTLNSGLLQTACAQQRCFGGGLAQNTPSTSAPAARRLMAVEEEALETKNVAEAFLDEDVGMESEVKSEAKASSFFLTRWAWAGTQAFSRGASRLWTAVQQGIYASGEAFEDFLLRTARETVQDNDGYFPNWRNKTIRDWPSGNVYLNTTSATGVPPPALPGGMAFPLP